MGRYESKITNSSTVAKVTTNKAKCSYCITTCKGTCSILCTGHASNRPAAGQNIANRD